MLKARLPAGDIEVVWATMAIIAVVAASALAVAWFKKPGQMGVIESQSMDMTKIMPPAGAVPVAVAAVKSADVEGCVTYTGSIRAFNEDDIYPRLPGRITHMYVYPGDHVRAGQLLATIDTANSEYEERARETQYRAMAGRHAVDIAKEDYEQKQHEFKAAVAAEVRARKILQEAQANLNYWSSEIEREKKLLDQSVVSKQEYDSEFAQYQEAQAKVEAAQAELQELGEKAVAAKEETRGMFEHIHHSSEEANALSAAAQAQAIVQSYTRLVAPVNGVVTKRDVSPGVLVNPSMLVMRIDEIDKVRVQSEVATSDIDKIRLGAKVTIKPSENSNETISAKVTARFPAADPTSRTSVVEALIPNPNGRFLPGQYVVMNISTGSRNAIIVPTSALVYSGDQIQVWKAVGDQASKIALLTAINIGLTNGELTEVLSGLKPGDEVIYHGQEGLQPNTPVYPVEWGDAGPKQLPTGEQVAGNRLSPINHWRLNEKLDNILVAAYMQPAPVKGDSNQLFIELHSADGKPITAAAVKAKTNMPTMNMLGPNMQATNLGEGKYQFNSNFMSTLWDVDLTINGAAPRSQALKLQVEVP